MKDIEDYENCKSILFYADDKEEYYGFLTPEASKALGDYFEERMQNNERFTPETPVFRESYQLASLPARHLSLQLLTQIIEATLKSIKRVRTPNGRYTVQLIHGYRKYFNLVMKDRSNSNLSLCEKLMGHSVTIPLDNNYAPFSKEKLFEEFRKAIPSLIISDVERKQAFIESQKKKITEMESNEERIAKLEKRQEITASLVTSISDNVYDKIFDYKNMDTDQLHLMADLISLKMNTIPGFKKAFEKVIGVTLEEYAQRKKKKTLS